MPDESGFTPTHMNKVLWPEFTELAKLLNSYLDEATRDIISRAVHGDLSEADENPALPGGLEGGGS